MTVSFPGLDVGEPLPNLVVDLWARSNFWFTGFYLAHDQGQTETGWMTLASTGTGFGLPHPGLWVARDCGWRIWPVWLPYAHPQTPMTAGDAGLNPTNLGIRDGRSAVAAALRAHLERGATIYIDVETAISNQPADWKGFIEYLGAWGQTVLQSRFRGGAYVSWGSQNTASLLAESKLAALGLGPGGAAGPSQNTFALWPFVISGTTDGTATFTRARWDDVSGRETPLAPEDWPFLDHAQKPAWGSDWRVVGCQHDWRKGNTTPRQGQVLNAGEQAGLKGVHRRNFVPWCLPPGVATPSLANPPIQDIDLDSSRTSDPAHPFGPFALGVSPEANRPFSVRVYAVGRTRIRFATRLFDGYTAHPLSLADRPDDIWPPDPPAAQDQDPTRLSRGFDVLDAAAASRLPGYHDLFVLGVDGTVMTSWENPKDFYPKHRWDINWRAPKGRVVARRGGPIAASGGAEGRLDVLYASDDHRLVHQWWTPTAGDWIHQGEFVDSDSGCALVAPASTIAALHERTAGAGGVPRLHVLFTGFSFVPYPEPPWWNARRGQHETAAQYSQRRSAQQAALSSWQPALEHWRKTAFSVWHAIATLTSPPTWKVARIAGISSVAPSTGLGAAMTADGHVHLITQPHDRGPLQHSIYDGQAWSAPVNLPAPAVLQGGHDPRCAMSLCLAVSGPTLVCAFVDVERRMLWTSFDGKSWSSLQEAPTNISAASRLRAAPYALPTAAQPGYVDVLGVGEEGEVVVHRLLANRSGFVAGQVTTVTWPGPSGGPPA